MKTIFYLSVFASILLLPYGCDKVEGPYLQSSNAVSGEVQFLDTTPQPKTAIIEEFTGHRCGTCPPAAVKLTSMKVTYGKQLLTYSIHAGNFAKINDEFPYDFRNSLGDELFEYFGKPGNPNGMVNRMKINSVLINNYPAWEGKVIEELDKVPVANIFIQNEFNASDRKLTIHTKTKWLDMLSGSYSLVVLLTEDSIIKPQLDYSISATIPDYVHRHVLRSGVSTTFGEAIIPGQIGSSEVRSFSIPLKPDWNENHCEVVAYLMNAVNLEILHSWSAHAKSE